MVAPDKLVSSDQFPLRPHNSPAVKSSGNLMFVSGQLGYGDITQATKDAVAGLKAVLELGGSSLDKVVKFNIFIADMKNFAKMNEAFIESLPEGPKPARTCVQPAVLPGFERNPAPAVEIECIAEYA